MTDSPHRVGEYARQTAETQVAVAIDLDGTGGAQVATGVLFLDHMLTHIARHGCFDVTATAHGDVQMDAHHTVEDVGIALGRAFAAAIGDGRGIVRMAHAEAPMDEALVDVAVDLSGRPYSVVDLGTGLRGGLGDMDVDMARHFMESFALEARINLHIRTLRGANAHHTVEAAFKGLARALDAASQRDSRLGNAPPSTKGVIG